MFSRICLPLSRLVVRIRPILHRTAAGEVPGHTHNALRTQLFALKAFNVGLHQYAGQLGILAKCSGHSIPAGLRRDIGHRRQRGLKAEGPIFLGSDPAELSDHVGIANGSESDLLGPLRNIGFPLRARGCGLETAG